jgi:hypothetical protein
MWEIIQVTVGPTVHRGRFRLEAGRLVLEWRGGRASEWCGIMKPELMASLLLKQLVGRMPVAA